MRSKFFIFGLLLLVTFCAADSLAQQPGCPEIKSVHIEALDADAYAELQQNAPEQLKIRISKILVRRVHERNSILPVVKRGLPSVLKTDYVDIVATVTEVKKSKSGLKNGDRIEIHYTTNRNYFVGDLEIWDAISPPMFEVNEIYTAFLKKKQIEPETDTDDGYRYVPVAYSKSFEQVKEHPNK